MKITTENNYLKSWDLYEVARFVPSLKRVIRDKNKLINSSEFKKYSDQNRQYRNIYFSVCVRHRGL